MQRYVALLRGIAPSGPNMTNDKLRGVFERLGFTAVGSILSSGNIVFDSPDLDVPALERRIEDALADQLGLSSRTIVRAYPPLRTLVDSDPFAGSTHGSATYLTATFLRHPTDVIDLGSQPDPHTRVVRYDEGAGVVLAITDASEPGRTPTFMVWLEKAYGKDITTRSWLTVLRIVRRLES